MSGWTSAAAHAMEAAAAKPSIECDKQTRQHLSTKLKKAVAQECCVETANVEIVQS